MNNPFSNPAFSMAALTAAINILPNRYGRLEELNLMPAKPVRQRQIVVEEMNGVLNLLPTLPPGSPGTVGVRGKRKLRSFVVPHIPHDDVVLPEEVQGIRAFGSETETETVAGVIARHLETMRNKHAITLEHLRMGALKGVILDADGSVLYDLFDAFEIVQQTVNFELGTAGTNVKAKCTTVLATIEENLKGEFMNGVHCLCSPEFFAALTGHAKVEKAFENWQNGAILINDVRRGFTYGGIPCVEWEEGRFQSGRAWLASWCRAWRCRARPANRRCRRRPRCGRQSRRTCPRGCAGGSERVGSWVVIQGLRGHWPASGT